MRKYLVNTTYCIYLLDVKHLYFDESIFTIKEVIEEIGHEREIIIEAPLASVKKVQLEGRGSLLSKTDSVLLQTSKVLDYILVTDDQKLITTAHNNGVHALDTPHFIHRLLMEGKWSKEKATDALNKLKSVYNRNYIINKVIKDIENWG